MVTNGDEFWKMSSDASQPTLVILGFGGHARSVADVAVAIGWSRIVFVDQSAAENEQFASFPAVRLLPRTDDPAWRLFPAAGENLKRRTQVEATPGTKATLISPSARVGIGATVGEATLVAHGAHIGPSAKIGHGVILNTHAIIEHEVRVGDFTHISVNAVVAGRSKIGSNVFLGAGAVVIDSVTVCSDVVIGAGAVVTDSIDEPGIYVGVPARRVK